MEGWKQYTDPKTGLIPRNKNDRYWNPKDAAADNFDFQKQNIGETSLSDIMFGSSEYIKYGLLPLTEWLGHSPW
ncbi:MAG: hypothetical protein HOH33_04075 [Verrucomicrobia bacterium]|nr:hypothetical protein [Verrucomicrobiota bacterium]